jgi:hypothetical protein
MKQGVSLKIDANGFFVHQQISGFFEILPGRDKSIGDIGGVMNRIFPFT